ncbi:MAG: HEPN domain-containing protein [Bifidobacteriaceae bacterium]|jgi:hypothetical protein|nr:HEPN domain-containing protein [Bifidobacteriaceae bacterium]
MNINRWQQGRTAVDQLLATHRIERVRASRPNADALLAEANRHLDSAKMLSDDPTGAFQLSYDAARKALAAILVNEGLRARAGEGDHAVVLDVALAQLDPPLGPKLSEFDWMRRLRNASQYPDFEHPVADQDDVGAAIAAAEEIVTIATKALDQMPVY